MPPWLSARTLTHTHSLWSHHYNRTYEELWADWIQLIKIHLKSLPDFAGFLASSAPKGCKFKVLLIIWDKYRKHIHVFPALMCAFFFITTKICISYLKTPYRLWFQTLHYLPVYLKYQSYLFVLQPLCPELWMQWQPRTYGCWRADVWRHFWEPFY